MSGDRGNDLVGGEHPVAERGPVRIDGGSHLVVAECRDRVGYEDRLVAELNGVATGRVDARVGPVARDDQTIDAVLVEQEVEVGSGETAGRPVLRGDDVAVLWRNVRVHLHTERTGLEDAEVLGALMRRIEEAPTLVVVADVVVVVGIDDGESCHAAGLHESAEVVDRPGGVRDVPGERPELASLGEKFVERVDEQDCGGLGRELSAHWMLRRVGRSTGDPASLASFDIESNCAIFGAQMRVVPPHRRRRNRVRRRASPCAEVVDGLA